MSDDVEQLAPGIEATSAATALRWIAESDLDHPDREVLEELVEGFPGLRFARELAPALDHFEEQLGLALPMWLRAFRSVMASPIGDPGPLRLEVDLHTDDPWAAGPWTVFPLRGASDETERALVTETGVIPVGYGGPGDSQVLAVSTEEDGRTLFRYDVEDAYSDDPLVLRPLLPDYLHLFARTYALTVRGERIERQGGNGPGNPGGPGGSGGPGDLGGHGPGMRFFADLTGQDAGVAAASPPATLMGGLQELAKELSAISNDQASDDPVRQQQAAERAEGLRARLESHQDAGPSDSEGQAAAKARFQQRLEGTLRDAVGRLESLHDEVIAKQNASDDEA